MKQCRVCKETKPLADFCRHPKTRDRLAHECRACKSKDSKAKYQANKVARSAQIAAWQADNKERLAEAQSRYRKRHADKLRQKALDYYRSNKGRQRASNKAWYAANPEYSLAKTAARKYGIKASTPSWASKQAILAVYREARQRRKAGEDVHVDHIVPLKNKFVCGLHVEHNLRVIPASENTSKGNRRWPGMP